MTSKSLRAYHCMNRVLGESFFSLQPRSVVVADIHGICAVLATARWKASGSLARSCSLSSSRSSAQFSAGGVPHSGGYTQGEVRLVVEVDASDRVLK
ncbi:hypothetical protein ABZX92_31900, partial [Lentzea sp. NPDC006480]|uniref:hypothetical protein n=1 Tax=Lentzea sp. NPDC006480 TaxID=3157176 RepID=UPI0033AD3B33